MAERGGDGAERAVVRTGWADVPGFAEAWLALATASFRSVWQYRASAVLLLLGSAATTALDGVAIVFLLRTLPALHGFDLADMAVLYGAANLAMRIADALIGEIDKVGDLAREGTLDQALLRPAPVVLQLAAGGVRPSAVGKLAQAIAVLVVGLVAAHAPFAPVDAGLLLLSVLSGSAIMGAVWLTGAAITSTMTGSSEAMNAFTYGGGFITSYPLDLYSRWFRRVFCYLVPLAFVCWFPVLGILDKPDPLGLPTWLRWTPPLVAAAALTVASSAWRLAVRRYRSTGS